MAHIVVKFEGDKSAIGELSKALGDAMGDDVKFHGVDVTALSLSDEFQRLEDMEEAEDIEEIHEILSRPYL